MSYKALYQKYRSKTFEDVVGQEYVVKSIRNSVHSNKISHAYLFCGPRGTGKTTMARLLAKAVNCQDPEHAPCQKCDDCIAADNGTHPDIIEMNAANTRGIDDIRSLINSAMLAPQRGSVPARPGPPAVVMALSSTVHESVDEVFFSICW